MSAALRRHMEHALAAGATPEELLQVVLLTASASAHATHELGFSILAEEMPDVVRPLSAAEQARKQSYSTAVGSWPEAGDLVLSLCPEFAPDFLAYRRTAWESGPLPNRIKELILMAVNASPSTLYADGVRRHMRAAIASGASAGEITEALQLASAIAVHTCTFGVPALMDAVNPDSAP